MGFNRKVARRRAREGPAPRTIVEEGTRNTHLHAVAADAPVSAVAAMLSRCPECGSRGRLERTCEGTTLSPEHHRSFVEVYGADHLHLYCLACDAEGAVALRPLSSARARGGCR